MQMYKGLPIITNKISVEEQRGIPHHLLGNIELDEVPWHVTKFKREATAIISDIRARGKLPIIVGGTSYYIDGLLFDDKVVDDGNTEQAEVVSQEELEAKFPILGAPVEVMMEKLREVDPVIAERWHPNDARKIQSSLRLYLTTGRRASDIYAEQKTRKESKWASSDPETRQSLWNILMFWLYAGRDALNDRLDRRVDKMVQNGLLSETAEVYDQLQARLASGEIVDRARGIVQSIGFWQFEPYLRAVKETPDAPEVAALRDAGIENTKTATRRYANYQVRWITHKTIPSLREEGLLDRLFLLDSADVQAWAEEVAAKGVELTRKFLAGEQLPQPVDVSPAAKEALTLKVEQSKQQKTPCNKTCEFCQKTFMTEEDWQKHIKSKRHGTNVRRTKRKSIVAYEPKRISLVVDDETASDQDPSSLEVNGPP